MTVKPRARNALLVALVAAVLVYVAFFLRDLFDTTVYTEENLASFGLPILGIVPSFPSQEGERPTKDKGVRAK